MNFYSKDASTESPQKRSFAWLVVLLLCVLSLSVALYFYLQWKKAVQSPSASSAAEIAEMTEYIGSFMQLPQGEEPTLATVIDRNELEGQPFFAQAQNGDKVLIYTNARKAILYRPETKMIIEVAPIFFEEGEALPPGTDDTEAATQ